MPQPLLSASPGSGIRDRPLLGIAFAVASGAVFSVADAIAKLLALTLPVVEITWFRWCGFLVAIVPILLWTRGGVLRRSLAPGLQVVRAVCVLGSSLLFIAALSFLPLASTTTINFVSPIIVTALSIPLLGETVGIRRWAAVVVGLIGVVIVVRPGSGAFGAAALLPIVSASCWAAGVIATRKLGGLDGPWTTMSFTALIGFAALGTAVLWDFRMPSLQEAGLAAVMATATTVGQFLTLAAYRNAPASLAAPFVYVTLIWTSALGYVLFGSVPDGPTGIGAAIIIASGIYTAHRERMRARDAALKAAE